MVRHAEYVVASCVVAALGPPVALSLARPSTTMIADLRHRQLMRGDRGARFRVISNYQPRRRRRRRRVVVEVAFMGERLFI